MEEEDTEGERMEEVAVEEVEVEEEDTEGEGIEEDTVEEEEEEDTEGEGMEEEEDTEGEGMEEDAEGEGMEEEEEEEDTAEEEEGMVVEVDVSNIQLSILFPFIILNFSRNFEVTAFEHKIFVFIMKMVPVIIFSVDPLKSFIFPTPDLIPVVFI